MEIRAVSLCKSFRHKTGVIEVLKGLDLSVGQAQAVAIMGASGAGKSTLLHILGTLDHPTSGTVTYDGLELNGRNGQDLTRFRNENIGFVFQAFFLLPEFTARENVMMPALIRGMTPAEAQSTAEEILRAVGLENRSRHRPGELSGGEQQRVAIARALILKPRILLADEPTGNLDQNTGAEIFELLRKLQHDGGMTLIMATHNLHLSARMDVAYRLEGGKLQPA
ncbi:MAG: ABC transporter ATP-binding protein [Nitrospirae bacterium]|nr:ABC transporter ATP-binding protein [Nitrospirota bacterium]